MMDAPRDTDTINLGGRATALPLREGTGTMKCKLVVTLLALVGPLVACSNQRTLADVQVSFSTHRPPGPLPGERPPAASRLSPDTQVTGQDTLIATLAQIVLRAVELRRANTTDCSGMDACEEFAAGPVLVTLPLGSGIQTQFQLPVPPNTYVEVEFDVHKVGNSDPGDLTFLAAHPEFANLSIRVQGTFDGRPFTYTTDLNVTQRLPLNPSLVITDNAGSANVTVVADLHTWFRVNGVLVDPTTANKGGPNENAVKDNITASFLAFDDNDRNGAP